MRHKRDMSTIFYNFDVVNSVKYNCAGLGMICCPNDYRVDEMSRPELFSTILGATNMNAASSRLISKKNANRWGKIYPYLQSRIR